MVLSWNIQIFSDEWISITWKDFLLKIVQHLIGVFCIVIKLFGWTKHNISWRKNKIKEKVMRKREVKKIFFCVIIWRKENIILFIFAFHKKSKKQVVNDLFFSIHLLHRFLFQDFLKQCYCLQNQEWESLYISQEFCRHSLDWLLMKKNRLQNPKNNGWFVLEFQQN